MKSCAILLAATSNRMQVMLGLNTNRRKILCRIANYKSIEEEAGVCNFDWIIGLLCCFVLKLCVTL